MTKYFLSLTLIFFVLGVEGQSSSPNIKFGIDYSIVKSKAEILNPFWLEESQQNSELGDNISLGIDFRILKNIWLGLGAGYYKSVYDYERIDPFNKSKEEDYLLINQKGFELYPKLEVAKTVNLIEISLLYKAKLRVPMRANNIIYYQSGEVKKIIDQPYLFGRPRNRNDIGLSIGRFFGEKRKNSTKITFIKSFDYSSSNSALIDVLKLNEFSIQFSYIRNMKLR